MKSLVPSFAVYWNIVRHSVQRIQINNVNRYPLQSGESIYIYILKTLNRAQLVSIVAPVWSKQVSWKGTRWCTLFLDGTSVENISYQRHTSIVNNFQVGLNVVSIRKYLTTLYTWAFLSCGVTIWASPRCGKAWGTSRPWFWWNVCWTMK